MRLMEDLAWWKYGVRGEMKSRMISVIVLFAVVLEMVLVRECKKGELMEDQSWWTYGVRGKMKSGNSISHGTWYLEWCSCAVGHSRMKGLQRARRGMRPRNSIIHSGLVQLEMKSPVAVDIRQYEICESGGYLSDKEDIAYIWHRKMNSDRWGGVDFVLYPSELGDTQMIFDET